jgi:Fe-S-cluster containining protein
MDLSPCNGCDSCGLRCEAGVQMSREEYETVQRYVESSSDREYIDQAVRQDKTVDLGDGVTVQMCRYRDMEKGGCAVYPARPLICRLLGHVEWMPCPIEKVPLAVPTKDAVALMREYSTVRRLTFEEWEAEDSRKGAETPRKAHEGKRSTGASV